MRRKKEEISENEIQLLNALGFTWQHRERGSWDDRLAKVAAFKSVNMHCDIPVKYSANPRLGRFVNSTRTQRNGGKLSAARIAKPDELGFVWESSQAAGTWERRFEKLLCYKKAVGDCKVPTEWPENLRLGHWVSHYRQLKKKGKIEPEREQRLSSIGFDWGKRI